MLSYSRPEKEDWLCFWYQCSQHVWSHDYGSSFTCEFQIADKPRPGIGRRRSRLGGLLSRDEWSTLCAMNLAVQKKQREYFLGTQIGSLAPAVQAMYRNAPPREPAPTPHLGDIWIDYKDPDDVALVGEFLGPRLDGWIEKFLAAVVPARDGA